VIKRPSNKDIAFGVLLFAAALLPRLWAATAFASEPVWDGQYYDFGAHRIAEGFGYSDDRMIAGEHVIHPWCHYPVGYSAVLGFFYWVFGAKPGVAIAFHSIVGAFLAVMTWLVARHAMSSMRARIAGVIVAAYPGLILYSALYMTEPLAALATMTAFWLAVRDPSSRRGFVLGALGLGISALIRPQALLCVPFLAFVLRPPVRKREWIARVAIASAIALVPVLPWTARNCAVMDGCALVSTNAGWNLAIGSFPRATGRFETLHSEDGCRDVTGQVQQDRCWFSLGMANIKSSPGRWLGLVPAKLGFTFDHESFPIEYIRQGRLDRWPEPRRVAWRDFTSTAFRALATFAALGCVGFARRGRATIVQGVLAAFIGALILFGARSEAPTFWPLVLVCCVVPWLPLPGAPRFAPAMKLGIALLGTTALTHAVFFGEDRYHMVVVPPLAMLAAGLLRQSRT
jgi:4-amino-4-deoxy-L-arabinose transferase-like glycosyltransferase